MTNIKLTLAYDGTDFFGWQKTPMGPSIEGTLEQAIRQILQEPANLQAASRTDAGVHAQGQIVNFHTTKENLALKKLCIGINALLPKTISVLNAEEMPAAFHPTLDCTGKEYHYDVCLGMAQLPQFRLYSWHCPYYLDLSQMRQAAQFFLGKHDFSAFCNVKKNEKYLDHTRIIEKIETIELPENRLRFRITGNHFLYKMVRNIVGTLVYVGRGKLQVEEIPKILESVDRTQAGVTAPAHGLMLYKVLY